MFNGLMSPAVWPIGHSEAAGLAIFWCIGHSGGGTPDVLWFGGGACWCCTGWTKPEATASAADTVLPICKWNEFFSIFLRRYTQNSKHMRQSSHDFMQLQLAIIKWQQLCNLLQRTVLFWLRRTRNAKSDTSQIEMRATNHSLRFHLKRINFCLEELQ